jgi:hypothetical protein
MTILRIVDINSIHNFNRHLLQNIFTMKSLSKKKSLCMIPELPGLEEHYASFYAMNLSPAASPRRELTLTRKREARKLIVKESLLNALTILDEVDESSSSMKREARKSIVKESLREARKSIVKESLLNALTIFDEVDESSSSMEFLDTSTKSIATSSTGPLTDDERDYTSSFSSTNDEAEYPPGASDLGKFRRWGLRCSRNDYSSKPHSSRDGRGIQEEPQQHNRQEEHDDEKHFLNHHDCPPVCPVRKRAIQRHRQQATSSDE